MSVLARPDMWELRFRECLSQLIRGLGYSVYKSEMQQYFMTLPNGVQGMMDLQQFLDVMKQKISQKEDPVQLKRALSAFEEDGVDYMLVPRFRAVMRRMGAQLTEDELEALLAEVEKDGKVQFDDLIRTVMGA